MVSELALFPLNQVLLPGGELPLRVFEARYRRLLDECGQNQPFGVVRIRYGQEVGEPAFPYDIGCCAYVLQRVTLPDESQGVLAVGDRRFRIDSIHVEADGLARARVQWLPPDPEQPIPAELQVLANSFPGEGAASLSWALAEALPLSLDERQQILEEGDPQRRLWQLKQWLLRHPERLV